MPYLWDSDKAHKNLLKHGISFDEAAWLLDGDYVAFKANVNGEPRVKAITRCLGEYFAIVFVERDSVTRIISARHATAKERSCYDRHING